MTSETDPHPDIELSSNLNQFFRSVVQEAIRTHSYETTHAAETYLVALLTDYARPDQLTGETLCRPLTLLLQEAMQLSGPERFERLRVLGDGVLYVTGFFGDHLDTRGVARSYVNALGARAYDGAASMLRSVTLNVAAEPSTPDLFRELSEKFPMFVELLSRIADGIQVNGARSDRAMLKIYERWLKTGSHELAQGLFARGLVPLRGDHTVH
ncbi:MAG TPA: hypothetical protein VK524_15095 [Polyangiaceae bacterium]|nr:hypothetical protein [Polyangiaceae bacterium]